MSLTIEKNQLDHLLRTALAEDLKDLHTQATASAIQAAAGNADHVLYSAALGHADLEQHRSAPITEATPFDIASITKALVGATLAMQAIDEGRLRWQTPLTDILPEWKERADDVSKEVTFLQLLNHTSGIAPWYKFYLEYPLDPTPPIACQTRRAVLRSITQMPLEAPPGARHAYSDLGYLLLAQILEGLFDGQPLSHIAQERIFAPLGLHRTTFVDIHRGDSPIHAAVATELCPLRGRLLRGTVHDENTNIIGGVSTHAGVFSTAKDLLKFGAHLLAIDQGRALKTPLVTRKTLQFAWSQAAGSPTGSHRAGWDTPSGARSSAGRGFDPRHTVGHLGFTGTSLWIERKRGVVSVLLTNRVYPSRENPRIKDLRVNFQEALLPPQ